MRIFNYLLFLFFAGILIYSAADLPDRGDAEAPFNRHQSLAESPIAATYYIQQAYRDARTPNIVTVILVDYRGYDTLGEETVVFIAGLICYLIFRITRRKDG